MWRPLNALRKQAFKGRFLIRVQIKQLKEVSVMKDSDISDITNIKNQLAKRLKQGHSRCNHYNLPAWGN